MSDVDALAIQEAPPLEPRDIDAELSALYDRDQVNNGAERGENGKFVSPNPAETEPPVEPIAPVGNESVLEGAEAGEAAGAEGSTPSVSSVPLPANWTGKDEVWSKIPDDIKPMVAEIQGDLQNRLIQQGRQVAEVKPISDAVNEFRHLFEGKIEPAEGIRRLARAQEGLENPQTRLQTLFSLIDGYGAREHISAILSGRAQVPQSQQPSVTPRDIEEVVGKKLAEDRASREATEEVSRLSKDKPLYAEIPETTMVQFIKAAWSVLGDTASKEAVFNTAYDMATDSIPALKAKKTAAARPAVVPKPVSPEAAKRANSVNVPSTSTGKVREQSEQELLEAIYDKHQRG